MPVKIAQVGLSGYGDFYLNQLLSSAADHDARLVGGIDPYSERSSWLAELQQAGVPTFPSLEGFYQRDTADLVIIATPIQHHAPLTCLALAHGSNVLCEKPLAGSLADAQKMLAAEKASGKFVAIGYQWSFSDPIQALKRDILAGRFGQPKKFKTLVLWPRHRPYYQRNDWAGRIKSNEGAWVLDSPVNNAAAHYLHNMLYLLGPAIDRSSAPHSLEVELYRANPIENYDAAALRIVTEAKTRLHFLTAHSVEQEIGPWSHFEFEDAVVEYPLGDQEFQVQFHNGKTESYGAPEATSANKLWHSVEAVRTGRPLACGILTALPHLTCVVAAQQAPITTFPDHQIKVKEDGGRELIWAEGLGDNFMLCYQTGQMPSKTQVDWSMPATTVDLSRL